MATQISKKKKVGKKQPNFTSRGMNWQLLHALINIKIKEKDYSFALKGWLKLSPDSIGFYFCVPVFFLFDYE